MRNFGATKCKFVFMFANDVGNVTTSAYPKLTPFFEVLAVLDAFLNFMRSSNQP